MRPPGAKFGIRNQEVGQATGAYRKTSSQPSTPICRTKIEQQNPPASPDSKNSSTKQFICEANHVQDSKPKRASLFLDRLFRISGIADQRPAFPSVQNTAWLPTTRTQPDNATQNSEYMICCLKRIVVTRVHALGSHM